MGVARGPRCTVASGGPWPPKGPITFDQGSHRLISLTGALTGDTVLIGARNTYKEVSFLEEASNAPIPRKFARATPHRRSKDLLLVKAPRRFREAFRQSKGAFNRFVEPSVE